MPIFNDTAFNDVICPKCRKRFGFDGALRDCPPCPACGYQIPAESWVREDELLAEFRQFLSERKGNKDERS